MGSPGVRVPDPRRFVRRSAVTMCFAVGLYAAVQTRSLMSLRTARVGWSPRPRPAPFCPASGDDALAVGAIRRGIDAILMSLEDGEGAGVRVPDPRRFLLASGDDALAVGAIRRGIDAILMSLRTARVGRSPRPRPAPYCPR